MGQNAGVQGTGKGSVAVALEPREHNVIAVRLGAADERVVTLTKDRMASLRAALAQIRERKPRAVIFYGSQPEMFTAGADINVIRDVTDPAVGEALAREGQKLFDEIEQLPCPTIAAISGPCVGGGCELVLACTYRIITDHKSSVIGLPEIKLGILPGFGGTQRLPRLVGLPKALDIILAGKTLRPAQAVRCGLVDEVVSVQALSARAESIARGERLPHRAKVAFVDRLLTGTRFGRNMVLKKARAQIKKETRGFYPAPPAALEAAVYGLDRGQAAGLEHEAKELGRLIVTPESKALVKIFFLTEASKSIGKSARKSVDQLRSVVIGAGTMGAGIAGALARTESSVILKDNSEESLSRGMNHVRSGLAKIKHLTEAERSFVLNRIEATTRDSSNLGNANFVIEAVFEDINVKKKLLADMARAVSPEAIIATNTSSLSVTEIASAIERPERVVGMHFFNPVEKMPLVEIVRGAKTSDKTIAVIAALTSKLGKFPIVVTDVPGFLVNRILSPYLNEAAFLLKDGFSVENIDRAALAFGMPMGPLRLLDEVGLDVAAHVAEIMLKGYGERMSGPRFAAALVAAGRKGRKNGAGFYDFKDKESRPHAGIQGLLKIESKSRPNDERHIQERLVMSLLNEAVRCLDDGVAGVAGPDAASQVDLGTVMGIGFPPFRGGVLHYADSLGSKNVLATLQRLDRECGARFSPAPGIAARAKSGGSFCK